jgi:hypothetical protein
VRRGHREVDNARGGGLPAYALHRDQDCDRQQKCRDHYECAEVRVLLEPRLRDGGCTDGGGDPSKREEKCVLMRWLFSTKKKILTVSRDYTAAGREVLPRAPR